MTVMLSDVLTDHPNGKLPMRRLLLIAMISILFLFLSIFLAPSVFASSSSQASITFSPVVNLSSGDTGKATFPWVTNIQSNVYVAWTEGSGGLRFRYSPDGGSTWLPAIGNPSTKLSNPGGVVQAPIVCANSSNVYVSWSQTVGSTGLQVFVASSNNHGASFTRAVQLSQGSPPQGWITPVCAAAGNDAYVNWINDSPNQSWIASTNNGGKTWSAPHQYGLSRENELAALNTATTQNAYSYSNRNVVVTHNGGATWTHVTNTKGDEGMITASGPYVYIATQTKTPTGYIHFYYSSNYGKSFKTVNDSTPTLPDSWEPQVASYGNSVWMTLIDYPGGSKANIYVYTSHDGGTSWASGPISVSGTGHDDNYPFTISTSDGQNIFVGFTQQTSGKPGWGPGGVWTFKVGYSTDGGSTWTSDVNISQNAKGAAGFQSDLATGAISSYGTHCFATWEYVNGNNYEVQFSHS
jgi:hypothetical protein